MYSHVMVGSNDIERNHHSSTSSKKTSHHHHQQGEEVSPEDAQHGLKNVPVPTPNPRGAHL